MTKLNLLPKKPNPIKLLWLAYKDYFILACVIVFFFGIAIGVLYDSMKERNKREVFAADIKERCKPIHNVMRGNSLRTTYECPPTGETFEIEGKI